MCESIVSTRFRLVLRPLFVIVAIAAVVACPIVYFIAFYTVAPTFSVESRRMSNGICQLQITPNFVVNSIYRVSVRDATGVVYSREEPVPGSQRILLPIAIRKGAVLVVECDLQFDRIAPSITTVTQSVTVQ